MCAIARRRAVSAEVCRSLVDHGDEETVHTLLGNARAEISEDALGTALDRFGQSERIQGGIIDRPAVSASLAQRLARLAAQTPVTAALPGYVEERSDAAWETHLSRMIADKALREPTLVRELCLGNFDFFARGLSALSKAPYAEISAALLETPPALAPFWQSAALPVGWLPVASATVAALVQIDRTANKADRQLFARNVVDRALANLKAQKIALTDAQRRVFAGARGRACQARKPWSRATRAWNGAACSCLHWRMVCPPIQGYRNKLPQL
jgi:hypothetical protein